MNVELEDLKDRDSLINSLRPKDDPLTIRVNIKIMENWGESWLKWEIKHKEEITISSSLRRIIIILLRHHNILDKVRIITNLIESKIKKFLHPKWVFIKL